LCDVYTKSQDVTWFMHSMTVCNDKHMDTHANTHLTPAMEEVHSIQHFTHQIHHIYLGIYRTEACTCIDMQSYCRCFMLSVSHIPALHIHQFLHCLRNATLQEVPSSFYNGWVYFWFWSTFRSYKQWCQFYNS